jgi:hypothetical protein
VGVRDEVAVNVDVLVGVGVTVLVMVVVQVGEIGIAVPPCGVVV